MVNSSRHSSASLSDEMHEAKHQSPHEQQQPEKGLLGKTHDYAMEKMEHGKTKAAAAVGKGDNRPSESEHRERREEGKQDMKEYGAGVADKRTKDAAEGAAAGGHAVKDKAAHYKGKADSIATRKEREAHEHEQEEGMMATLKAKVKGKQASMASSAASSLDSLHDQAERGAHQAEHERGQIEEKGTKEHATDRAQEGGKGVLGKAQEGGEAVKERAGSFAAEKRMEADRARAEDSGMKAGFKEKQAALAEKVHGIADRKQDEAEDRKRDIDHHAEETKNRDVTKEGLPMKRSGSGSSSSSSSASENEHAVHGTEHKEGEQNRGMLGKAYDYSASTAASAHAGIKSLFGANKEGTTDSKHEMTTREMAPQGSTFESSHKAPEMKSRDLSSSVPATGVAVTGLGASESSRKSSEHIVQPTESRFMKPSLNSDITPSAADRATHDIAGSEHHVMGRDASSVHSSRDLQERSKSDKAYDGLNKASGKIDQGIAKADQKMEEKRQDPETDENKSFGAKMAAKAKDGLFKVKNKVRGGKGKVNEKKTERRTGGTSSSSSSSEYESDTGMDEHIHDGTDSMTKLHSQDASKPYHPMVSGEHDGSGLRHTS